MEHCPGKTMMDRLETHGKFNEREAAQMIYKILEGLNHIHASDIVHRDLKPENIIIDNNGDPKIIDFGLSKDTLHNTRVLQSFVGSKIYMAPEVLMHQTQSPSIDLWSVGIITYLIVSGDLPFSASNLENDIIEAAIVFPAS